MFLASASAYQHLIELQNLFINEIISKNSMKGILNNYVSQLEQEIDIEDATKDIYDDTYKIFNELINTSSIRNIFTEKKQLIIRNIMISNII